jgi:hypothetical protein
MSGSSRMILVTCPPKTLPFITEKLRKTDEGKGALR